MDDYYVHRGLAGREGVRWTEFWPWLGDYVDLASELGLEQLEEFLAFRLEQRRRLKQEEGLDEDTGYAIFIDWAKTRTERLKSEHMENTKRVEI